MTDDHPSRPISIRRQIDAVHMQALGIKDVLSRRSTRAQPPPADEISAIRIKELEAAMATLTWVEKHEASIRAYLEDRRNARIA